MRMSEAEFQRQCLEATKRGAEERRNNPHAVAAHCDGLARRLVVDLSNHCSLVVPTDQLQGLRGAAAKDLEQVKLLARGYALDWPRLDMQFTITGLLAGVFGTKAWMAELRKDLGSEKSPAKTKVTRRNGAKSGRPRKRAAATASR